jgi:negative regulator of flagellin synthesis FlgM
VPNPIHGVNTTNPVAPATAGQTGPTSGPGTSNQSTSSAPVDSADVGGTETLLQTISTAAGQVPTIDSARVAELQKSIAAGTYQISPQQIAQKLLQVEAQLGSKGSDR